MQPWTRDHRESRSTTTWNPRRRSRLRQRTSRTNSMIRSARSHAPAHAAIVKGTNSAGVSRKPRKSGKLGPHASTEPPIGGSRFELDDAVDALPVSDPSVDSRNQAVRRGAEDHANHRAHQHHPQRPHRRAKQNLREFGGKKEQHGGAPPKDSIY